MTRIISGSASEAHFCMEVWAYSQQLAPRRSEVSARVPPASPTRITVVISSGKEPSFSSACEKR